MAFLPSAGTPGGVWALVALMGVSRLLLGGIVTLRSLVWTHNYERVARARVTAWLSIITIGSMSVTSLVAGLALDFDARAFRVVYAVGALVALIGVAVFSRIKLRPLTPEILPSKDAAQRDASPATARSREKRGGSLALLRGDPHYARYLFWQFVLGFSAMMAEAPIIWLVSRELAADPAIAVIILQFLPLALSALSLPIWGPYLARVHVARFFAPATAGSGSWHNSWFGLEPSVGRCSWSRWGALSLVLPVVVVSSHGKSGTMISRPPNARTSTWASMSR